MRFRLLTAAAVLPLVIAAGCKHGGSGAATPTPTAKAASQPAEEGTTSYQGTSAGASSGSSSSSGSSASAATPAVSPLPIDEARLKSWIAYRKELIATLGDQRKKLASLDGKSDAQKIAAMTKISEDTDKAQAALEKKYGFTKEQDQQILDAVTDVLGDMPMENPLSADSVAELKKQAAQQGADGDNARAQLQAMQDQEKKGLDDARSKYGDAAVALFVAHQPELTKQQQDAMNAAFGDR